MLAHRMMLKKKVQVAIRCGLSYAIDIDTIVAELKACGRERPAMRVAEIVGVNRSAVSRWLCTTEAKLESGFGNSGISEA
jgi:hypothetical protein